MFNETYQSLINFWYEHGDPRAQDFFILRSPFPVLWLIAIYIVICKLVLPAIFKGKKYQWPRYALVVTYIIQLGNCFFVIFYGTYLMVQLKFNLRCEPLIPSFDGYYYEYAKCINIWLLIKNLEMLESFLVYLLYGVVPRFIFIHHIFFPLFLTYFIHFYLGGSPLMFGLFHSLDHAFNYIFIALRMYSDEYRKKSDSWFKKYQFLSSVVSMIATVIFFMQLETRPDCDYTIFKYASTLFFMVFLVLTVYYRAKNFVNAKKKKQALFENNNNETHYQIVPKAGRFDPT
ncbi:hypothetical protein PVAND_012381 [Polypedilum vanderplanki]|uniref:Very-long-chain 3-oxoacyl-CoA synthase n=1 Tax=Polypedilum vanderplanki TaxID=319348 RepID=A0A9J6CMA9_POLVA|nr:hypothetical protein PVAND_012381 [Polypedilum vanderplanki]